MIKHYKRLFGRDHLLAAVMAAMLLSAAVFGITALVGCTQEPSQTSEAVTAAPASEPAETVQPTPAPTEAVQTAEPASNTDNPSPRTTNVPGMIDSINVRLNTFLDAIVQQNIVDSAVDLDEDAELVKFVFGYRKYYQTETLADKEDSDGTVCRTLTLEQVNETLEYYFGMTIDPDHEDYSILTGGDDSFHCFFRDGCFWFVPPYPVEQYSFPTRFALVDRINENTGSVHFRLYKINPDAWGLDEAERHVVLLPMFSFLDAETKNPGTKEWITRIGEGKAVFSDMGENMKLVSLKAELDH